MNKNVLFAKTKQNQSLASSWVMNQIIILYQFHLNGIHELSKNQSRLCLAFPSSTSFSSFKSLTESSVIAPNNISITLHIIRSRNILSSEYIIIE